MKCFRYAALFPLCAGLVLGQLPAGWKVLHDKTSACQVAVPADWSVDAGLPSQARAPKDQGDISVGSQVGRTVKPLSEVTQKALMVDKVIENTPQRVFWTDAPTKSAQPITQYHLSVPGKSGICTALISVRPGVNQETVAHIGATLSVVR